MKMEQYEIEQVRNEYVGAIASRMQGKINQADFNKMLTVLDDFLLALSSNNIMLIKVIIEDVQIPQQQEVRKAPEPAPLQVRRMNNIEENSQPEIQEEDVDEFEEEPLTPEETGLSEIYKRKMKELEDREKALIELENAKPVKFTDKIRQFEQKSKENKKEDEDED